MKIGLKAIVLAMVPLAIIVPGAAVAADWSFDPVVAAGVETSDNVFALGDVSDEDDFDPEDLSFYVAVTVAWTAETPRSAFTFDYTPFFERYQDFSGLDNTAHRVNLGYTVDTSARTSWELGGSWARQQRARVNFADPELDQFVLPQTEYDNLGFTVQTNLVVSERSRIVLFAAASATDYSENEIPAQDPDGDGEFEIPGVSVDDAKDVSLQAGWETDISPLSVAGVSVYATRIDEDRRGEYDVYRLLGVLRWGAEERVLTTLTLGGARSSVRDPGELGSDAEVEDQDFVVGTLTLEGTLFRRSSIRAGAFRDVLSSAGVAGTALSTGGYVAFATPTGRWSTLNLFARYTSRDPVEDELEDRAIDTLSYRAQWAVALSSRWHVVFAAEVFDQSSDFETYEGKYKVYSAGVRWTPNAPRR